MIFFFSFATATRSVRHRRWMTSFSPTHLECRRVWSAEELVLSNGHLWRMCSIDNLQSVCIYIYLYRIAKSMILDGRQDGSLIQSTFKLQVTFYTSSQFFTQLPLLPWTIAMQRHGRCSCQIGFKKIQFNIQEFPLHFDSEKFKAKETSC